MRESCPVNYSGCTIPKEAPWLTGRTFGGKEYPSDMKSTLMAFFGEQEAGNSYIPLPRAIAPHPEGYPRVWLAIWINVSFELCSRRLNGPDLVCTNSRVDSVSSDKTVAALATVFKRTGWLERDGITKMIRRNCSGGCLGWMVCVLVVVYLSWQPVMCCQGAVVLVGT